MADTKQADASQKEVIRATLSPTGASVEIPVSNRSIPATAFKKLKSQGRAVVYVFMLVSNTHHAPNISIQYHWITPGNWPFLVGRS